MEGPKLASTNYHCMVKAKTAMDEFLRGLEMGGVADITKSHLQLLKLL